MFVEIAGNLLIKSFSNNRCEIKIMRQFLNDGISGCFGLKSLDAIIEFRVDHKMLLSAWFKDNHPMVI